MPSGCRIKCPIGVQVKQMPAFQAQQLTMLVNPQWQFGQAVSDFGIGSRRKELEAVLEKFTTVYHLRQLRINGDDVKYASLLMTAN